MTEKTPSVYFQFDDSFQKSAFSNEVLFDYSCTNPKANSKPHVCSVQVESVILENPFAESSILEAKEKNASKIKTEEFFEEFDNNFVVMFDDEPLLTAEEQYRKHCLLENNSASEEVDLIDLSGPLKQISRTSKQAEINTMGLQSSIQEDPNDEKGDACEKENHNPNRETIIVPSFEVKKRTVFKNKQNLHSQIQGSKKTSKKVGSFKVLGCSDGLSINTCKINASKFDKPKFYTSKMNRKDRTSNTRNPETKSIFAPNTFKEPLRSTTLEQWKKKHLLNKKGTSKETLKAFNIFKNPFAIR